jgi:hypothetical protein
MPVGSFEGATIGSSESCAEGRVEGGSIGITVDWVEGWVVGKEDD